MLEVQFKSMTERPENWVPDLAVLLERYRDNQGAMSGIMVRLAEMGLIETVENPDRPGDYMLDTRVLQAVLAQFGPRITTASGQLGISATKGGIWTPGSEASKPGAGGGIWTPGSGAGASPKAAVPAAGGKPSAGSGPAGGGPSRPNVIVTGH